MATTQTQQGALKIKEAAQYLGGISVISVRRYRLLAALKGIHERERSAYREFNAACERDDPQGIEAALNKWLKLAPQGEFAEREFAAATALKNYGSVMTKFKAEFPHAKKTLLRVSELRLTQAKEEAATVLAEERQRLLPEGFTDAEIRNSTRSKRALSRVKNFETIQRRIENEPIEDVWRIFATQLLNC
jgi:hypothetical protein